MPPGMPPMPPPGLPPMRPGGMPPRGMNGFNPQNMRQPKPLMAQSLGPNTGPPSSTPSWNQARPPY